MQNNSINKLNYRTDSGAVWVGYLPQRISLKDFVAHFETCGSIYQAKLLRTTKSVQPFGFIWFENPDSAKLALALDRSCIQKSQIKVRYKRFQEVPMVILQPPPPSRNIQQAISSLEPVHIANPEALAFVEEETSSNDEP